MKSGGVIQYTQHYPSTSSGQAPLAALRAGSSGIEYRQGAAGAPVIEAIYHPEGRVFYTSPTASRYEYSVRDHASASLSTGLGNTRITLRLRSAQAFSDLNGTCPERSRRDGKELNNDWGLNLYDYGARMYMADVGRWGGVDALGEKRSWASTYQYVQNSPFSRIDPDGNLDDVIYLLWSPQEGGGSSGGASSGSSSNGSSGGSSAGSSTIGKISNHSAVLIGDDTNGWTLFSKDGGNDECGQANFTIAEFSTLEDFNSSYNHNRGYDMGVLIETSPEQDKKMKITASVDIETPYQLSGNNCADFCINAIESGGVAMQPTEPYLFAFNKPSREVNAVFNSNSDAQVVIFGQTGVTEASDPLAQRSRAKITGASKTEDLFIPGPSMQK